jgi:uncharacterized protein YcfL
MCMSPSRLPYGAVMALMAILLLAGCGANSPTTTTPSNAATTNTPVSSTGLNAYCNKLSVADVASITGKNILQESSDINEDAQSAVCLYFHSHLRDNQSATITILYVIYPNVDMAHQDLGDQKQSSNFPPDFTNTDLTGIGDEALAITHNTSFHVTFYRIRARKGAIVFDVSGVEDQTPPIYSPPLDIEKQLAQMIDSKL